MITNFVIKFKDETNLMKIINGNKVFWWKWIYHNFTCSQLYPSNSFNYFINSICISINSTKLEGVSQSIIESWGQFYFFNQFFKLKVYKTFLYYKGKGIAKKEHEEKQVFPSFKMCLSSFSTPLLPPKPITFSSLVPFK